MADETAIVIDNGSNSIKAGISNDDKPRIIFPSVVGKPKRRSSIYTPTPFEQCEAKTRISYGEHAFGCLSYPIQKGIITNWNDMEMLWNHIFYEELNLFPEEHPILLTEPPLCAKQIREKTTQIMFEDFNVPKFYIAITSVLSLLASGRTIGLVIDSGYDRTQICPVYEGYALPHGVIKTAVSGKNVTEYLQSLIRQNNVLNSGDIHYKMANKLKESICYVSDKYDDEAYQDVHYSNYELPDGQLIYVGKERFQAPELLFNPHLFGMFEDGIQHKICESIMKCDVDIRPDLFANIVLCGGNTMFNGMDKRLHKEITYLANKGILINGYIRKYYTCLYKDIIDIIYANLDAKQCRQIKVIAPPERKYSAWIGGAIVSSLSTFEEMWIEKDEYDETGPSIVHRKCT